MIKNEDHWIPKIGLFLIGVILVMGLFGAVAGLFVDVP